MLSEVLDHLRAAEAPDARLLETYVARRDDAAFAALVRRHGPMVWGVCRRLLPLTHDAEDAFQATFLVLARKASTIRPAERLAGWLHGVAYRAALKARAANARRRAREKQVRALPEPAAPEEGLLQDLLPLLDREVNRLPEKYRLPVVLCLLEGKTRKEVARRLGWPEGTVAGRLAEGRALLARRLLRHGLPASGGVVITVLCRRATAAVMPAPLLRVGTPGAASPSAVALVEGVMKAAWHTNLRVAAALGLALGLAAVVSTASWLPGLNATPAGSQLVHPDPGEPRDLGGGRQPVPHADTPAPAPGELEGSWRAESFQQDGRPLPEREVADVRDIVVTFAGDRYGFTKGMRVQGADRGTVRVDAGAEPKSFELTPESGPFQGMAFRGIYRREKDTLTLCFAWPPKDRPTEFRSPPNSTVVLAVFRRHKP